MAAPGDPRRHHDHSFDDCMATPSQEIAMTGLTALWLPILLSAVLVFVVSSAIHMVSPWHKSDYPRVPDEDKLRDALRPLAIPPGDYMVPRPKTREEMRSPGFADKIKQGPNLIVTVIPNGPWSMRQSLTLWFLYAVVVGAFAGYVAGRALPPGAEFGRVFRFAGVTAFVGYAVALWQMSIWYRRAWSTTIKASVDGVIYALLTAGGVGPLWPPEAADNPRRQGDSHGPQPLPHDPSGPGPRGD